MSGDKKRAGMNILDKIIQVIRDDSRALSEAVMDSTGNKIYEKQIEVAKVNLSSAKHAISDALAKESQCSRKVKLMKSQVDEHEQRIIKALSQNDEILAFDLATEMVELEQDLAAEAGILKSHELHLGHLTRQMENAERSLKELERQVAMVQTTADIQKATEVITKNFNQADSKMLSAKRSLERIRRKQQSLDEQYEVDDAMVNERKPVLTEKHQNEVSEQVTEDAADVLKRIIDKE
ncbi:PspA/IM30 family protein [Marinicella sp. S1101]|uniref:PspA/IM30 family protein n=1 Tax=Marinicella marina TaxID=2996016 RepID=UPI0022609D3E|nr:PspA/IM30 family protein [Marinicella marina]MCX7553584.1 PspA/IM30 family protein [Marinicella marina]MDJ1140208.1 PspA/IM30 family protein [Marinicella marina]